MVILGQDETGSRSYKVKVILTQFYKYPVSYETSLNYRFGDKDMCEIARPRSWRLSLMKLEQKIPGIQQISLLK